MSLNLPFERIKHIDTKYKCAVSGYLRNQILKIPESILLVILLFYYNSIESSILTDAECDKLLSLFEQENVLKNLKNCSYKLLFKGTRDGFKSKTFYEKCNKKNTLCIIHTERNYVFGGYTSISWRRTNGNIEYETDLSAFLFVIRSSKRAEAKVCPIKNNGEYAIAQGQRHYLSFGNHGWGFCLCQHGDNDPIGFASGGKCPEYNLGKYELMGQTCHFKPTEIEVFQLCTIS